jgi:hypothetical protein
MHHWTDSSKLLSKSGQISVSKSDVFECLCDGADDFPGMLMANGQLLFAAVYWCKQFFGTILRWRI